VGGAFAHHGAVSDRVVCGDVGPSLLLLKNCLKTPEGMQQPCDLAL